MIATHEWTPHYIDARYVGCIRCTNGQTFSVPENQAHELCYLLNGLVEGLAQLADAKDTPTRNPVEKQTLGLISQEALAVISGLGQVANREFPKKLRQFEYDPDYCRMFLAGLMVNLRLQRLRGATK